MEKKVITTDKLNHGNHAVAAQNKTSAIYVKGYILITVLEPVKMQS